MADWRLEWGIRAHGDFLDIVEFIARDSRVNARRVARRLDAAAMSLRQLPLRGRVPHEFPSSFRTTLRELAVPSWRMLYTVKGRIVKIAGVVDGRRDILVWLEREQDRFRLDSR
ncbi:MAG TPA: type II toxin-antitoxin system RelE/ParE family toxin [Rhodanobacteraceae bacterium]